MRRVTSDCASSAWLQDCLLCCNRLNHSKSTVLCADGNDDDDDASKAGKQEENGTVAIATTLAAGLTGCTSPGQTDVPPVIGHGGRNASGMMHRRVGWRGGRRHQGARSAARSFFSCPWPRPKAPSPCPPSTALVRCRTSGRSAPAHVRGPRLHW